MKTLNGYERLNPLNDYLFYKVMGVKGSEVQLTGFLNAVLGDSGRKPIKNLEIPENNFLAAEIISGKSCILDVKAILDDGTKVNIEVQLRNEHNMDRRSLFYWSRLYVEDMTQGQDYINLPNVIAINIVDFDFPPMADYHSRFRLHEDTDPDLILTSALEIHFINMTKWRKIKDKDIRNNPLHRWLLWFDEKSPSEQVEEALGMDNSIMLAEAQKAFFSQDRDERDLYLRRLMATLDYNSGMRHAREEGELTGKLDIARNALAEGLPAEVIHKITGLDLETINNLDLKD